MIKALYYVSSILRNAILNISGSKLNNIMKEVVDEYYYLYSQKKIHEECIDSLMKKHYKTKEELAACSYFVYSKKTSIDKAFEIKFEKRGVMLAHLFKLVQKIYIDKHLTEKKRSYEQELLHLDSKMKKSFNLLVLKSYSKYNS